MTLLLTATRTVAGWYLFDMPSAGLIWHFVDDGQNRSRCGHARTFDRKESTDRLDRLSPHGSRRFCLTCAHSRRAEEGR